MVEVLDQEVEMALERRALVQRMSVDELATMILSVVLVQQDL